MYEEQVRATFAQQTEDMENLRNSQAKAKYLADCEDYAARFGRGEKPVVPMLWDSSVQFEPEFVSRIFRTDRPMQGLPTPESFLPKSQLEGQPNVGKELKHMPGFFAMIGNKGFQEGEKITENGRDYIYVRTFFGLGGMWKGL